MGMGMAWEGACGRIWVRAANSGNSNDRLRLARTMVEEGRLEGGGGRLGMGELGEEGC